MKKYLLPAIGILILFYSCNRGAPYILVSNNSSIHIDSILIHIQDVEVGRLLELRSGDVQRIALDTDKEIYPGEACYGIRLYVDGLVYRSACPGYIEGWIPANESFRLSVEEDSLRIDFRPF